MKSYYDKLIEIKRNPKIYLGYPSLKKLKAFMDGYSNCSYDTTGSFELGLFNGFQEWIEYKFFNKKIDHNWADIICFYNISDEVSFDKFYELLDEFLKENK
jgi:hypothetical protein